MRQRGDQPVMGENDKNGDRDPGLTGPDGGDPAKAAEKTREVLMGLLDFCVAEGALIRAPQFVHYIEMARLELAHWQNPWQTVPRRAPPPDDDPN